VVEQGFFMICLNQLKPNEQKNLYFCLASFQVMWYFKVMTPSAAQLTIKESPKEPVFVLGVTPEGFSFFERIEQ